MIRQIIVVAALCMGLGAGAAWGQVTVPHTFSAGQPARADEVNANFQALVNALNTSSPAAIVIVPAVEGDPLASGETLLKAVDAITDASATKPYLVRLGPGVFDLGTASLTMKAFVDMEGSGQAFLFQDDINKVLLLRGGTVILSDPVTGITLNAAANAELRFLGVMANGAGTAVSIDSADPFRMTHVSVLSSGTTRTDATGIFINNASPQLTEVSASALGGKEISKGIHILGTKASPVLNHVDITAAGAPDNRGIHNASTFNLAPRFTNSTILSGGGDAYGLYNDFGAQADLINVTISAVGTIPCGLKGICFQGFGVFNLGEVDIERSSVSGNGFAIAEWTKGTNTVRVGASRLSGGVDPGAGAVVCAASYNGSYLSLSAGCL